MGCLLSNKFTLFTEESIVNSPPLHFIQCPPQCIITGKREILCQAVMTQRFFTSRFQKFHRVSCGKTRDRPENSGANIHSINNRHCQIIVMMPFLPNAHNTLRHGTLPAGRSVIAVIGKRNLLGCLNRPGNSIQGGHESTAILIGALLDQEGIVFCTPQQYVQ